MEHTARDPYDAAVLPDLDPELDGLPLGVPVGVFGEGEEHRRPPVVRYGSATFSNVQS